MGCFHGVFFQPATSCSPDSLPVGQDDDEFAPENVTFAPKDVTPVDFTPRSGLQGLGYRGLNPGLALLGHGAAEHIDLFKPQSESRSQLFGERKSGSRRGGVAGQVIKHRVKMSAVLICLLMTSDPQAFGVGALEDDDEDVYHRDSMSKYDTVLGGEEPGDGLYGWTAPQQYTKKTGAEPDRAGQVHLDLSNLRSPPKIEM